MNYLIKLLFSKKTLFLVVGLTFYFGTTQLDFSNWLSWMFILPLAYAIFIRGNINKVITIITMELQQKNVFLVEAYNELYQKWTALENHYTDLQKTYFEKTKFVIEKKQEIKSLQCENKKLKDKLAAQNKKAFNAAKKELIKSIYQKELNKIKKNAAFSEKKLNECQETIKTLESRYFSTLQRNDDLKEELKINRRQLPLLETQIESLTSNRPFVQVQTAQITPEFPDFKYQVSFGFVGGANIIQTDFFLQKVNNLNGIFIAHHNGIDDNDHKLEKIAKADIIVLIASHLSHTAESRLNKIIRRLNNQFRNYNLEQAADKSTPEHKFYYEIYRSIRIKPVRIYGGKIAITNYLQSLSFDDIISIVEQRKKYRVKGILVNEPA